MKFWRTRRTGKSAAIDIKRVPCYKLTMSLRENQVGSEAKVDLPFTPEAHATHEAGQALACILNDLEVVRVKIGRLSKGVYEALVKVLGNYAPNPSEIITSQQGTERLRQSNPDQHMLTFLAGPAADATVDPKLADQYIASIHGDPSEDIGMSGYYIERRIRSLFYHKVKIEEIEVALRAVLLQLTTIFSQEHFQRAIKTIQTLFLEHRGMRRDVDARIREALKQDGIGDSELERMASELKAIDVDAIIRHAVESLEGGQP